MKLPNSDSIPITEENLSIIMKMSESMPGGFFLYRANDKEELIFSNSKLRAIFGCADEEEFLELTGNTFKGMVHPDDYQCIRDAIHKQVKISDDKYDHVKYRIIRRDGTEGVIDDYGRLVHTEEFGDIYCVFVIDISAQASAENLNTVLASLSEDYNLLCHIDFETGKLDMFRVNGIFNKEGYNYKQKLSYEEYVSRFAEKYVVEDDRELFVNSLEKQHMIEQIESDTDVVIRFRIRTDSDEEWYELKSVHHKDHGDRKCSIVGIKNVNKEVLQRIDAIIDQKKSIEQQRNAEILEILASEFSCVYYIDLDTGELHITKINDMVKDSVGHMLHQGINYAYAWKEWMKLQVQNSDYEDVIKFSDIDFLRSTLKHKSSHSIIYRVGTEENFKYHEIKIVKVNREAEATALVVGIADRDKEIREKQKQESENRRNTEIIEILASEYSSVYYIDLTTDGLNPYTMNEETETTFGSVFRSGITYSEAYRLYVDKLIYPEDKARMLRAGSAENIRNELRNKKTFITTYRDAENKYSEMKFVKVGGDYDEPEAVALGFAEKDEEIRQKQSAEQERQMNFDIIEILASEYSSVYYIDLTTDGLNPYTMNEETETTFGSVFRSGITYSEAYRLYVDKLIYPEDKAMMLKAGSIGNIMKELRTKKTFLTTYRNAEGHYSEMKYVKVGNNDGAPTAVALGFADKDEELRAKQEEERVLQRNIDIIEILASEYSSVYYIDMTTDELDPYTMNEQTESQFGEIFRSGIKYSDAFKMYVDKLVYPEDKAMMLKAGSIYNILDQLSNKKSFLTQYRNSDGEYCEMKFVKVGDAENPQSVALGFSNKDSEIREERTRKEKQDRDNAVITSLSDDFGCVVYTDYEAYSEVHYRFDPLFEEHIEGWSEISNFKERLEALTNTIMHPDDRKAFWDATRPEKVRSAVDNEGFYYINFRTLIDGEETYYQAKFARDERHPDTNVIAGFHNVDAETKREMEALEKARTANKAKTDFLFNMSHDIRTPMNAIMGFTNMAMKNADNQEIVIDSLKKTQLSGELLLSLINNILDMSRIESGKITLDENEADIEKLFDHIDATMQELAKQKNIELTFNVDNVKDRYVYCDMNRIIRVLVNLVTNAIKYTNEGGFVKVSCSQTGTRDGCGIYRYIFEDNGIGMSEEFRKRAFDEFARENTATVSGVQGTGLGLSVCRSFVQAMNGTIECESTQGKGTTFTVTVPLKIREPEAEADNKATASEELSFDLTGKRILVVEDNELNMEIASFILAEEGAEVEMANDGSVAVKMLKDKGSDYYHGILMDIQMPVMDGYEATREIRKLYPDAGIPIIATSANVFSEDRDAAIAAGMDAAVPK